MPRPTIPAEAPTAEWPSLESFPALEGRVRDWSAEMSAADRACCCPARPVVAVVLPLSEERPDPIELLLCGHHYRAAREGLAEIGALVFDSGGKLVTTQTWLAA